MTGGILRGRGRVSKSGRETGIRGCWKTEGAGGMGKRMNCCVVRTINGRKLSNIPNRPSVMLWRYKAIEPSRWPLSALTLLFMTSAMHHDSFVTTAKHPPQSPNGSSDGLEVKKWTLRARHLCVYWYIKAQTCLCQAVCRTLFPNTGCFTLCLLLQTEGAQKRSCSTAADRSTFRPRADLKQPDKVLALAFLSRSRPTHPHRPLSLWPRSRGTGQTNALMEVLEDVVHW